MYAHNDHQLFFRTRFFVLTKFSMPIMVVTWMPTKFII